MDRCRRYGRGMHAKVKSSLLHLADMQTRSQSHAYDTHTYERGVFFHGLVHDASHLALRRLHHYGITTRSRPPDILHYPHTEDKEWLVCIHINSRPLVILLPARIDQVRRPLLLEDEGRKESTRFPPLHEQQYCICICILTVIYLLRYCTHLSTRNLDSSCLFPSLLVQPHDLGVHVCVCALRLAEADYSISPAPRTPPCTSLLSLSSFFHLFSVPSTFRSTFLLASLRSTSDVASVGCHLALSLCRLSDAVSALIEED